MIDISVVIPVSSLVPESVPARLETLQLALRHLYRNVEVIVVEQSLDGSFYFLPKLDNKIKKIELRNPVFNKGWCLNVGVANAKNNYIVLTDCDMYARNYDFDMLLYWMKSNRYQWAFAWNRLIYTNQEQKKLILDGNMKPGLSYCTPTPGYSEGGLVCVSKDFYAKVGKMNECMIELGGIDNEFIARCKYLTENQYPMYPFTIYHLFHPQRRKSSRPSRGKNIQILKKSRQDHTATIDWLCAQNQGCSTPLSDRKGFLE